jgi:HPt (histidine-containing phosphotransfer) domain-containing protein
MTQPFNRNRLSDLMGGDEEAVREVLGLAANAIPGFVKGLFECSTTPEEAARLAHSLKGVASNVGADELAETAGDLQHALAGGWTAEALQRARSLPSLLQRLQDAWEFPDSAGSTS